MATKCSIDVQIENCKLRIVTHQGEFSDALTKNLVTDSVMVPVKKRHPVNSQQFSISEESINKLPSVTVTSSIVTLAARARSARA